MQQDQCAAGSPGSDQRLPCRKVPKVGSFFAANFNGWKIWISWIYIYIYIPTWSWLDFFLDLWLLLLFWGRGGVGNDEGNTCQVQWSCCYCRNIFVDKPLGDVSRPLGSHEWVAMMLSVAPSLRVFEMDIPSANCIADQDMYTLCIAHIRTLK